MDTSRTNKEYYNDFNEAQNHTACKGNKMSTSRQRESKSRISYKQTSIRSAFGIITLVGISLAMLKQYGLDDYFNNANVISSMTPLEIDRLNKDILRWKKELENLDSTSVDKIARASQIIEDAGRIAGWSPQLQKNLVSREINLERFEREVRQFIEDAKIAMHQATLSNDNVDFSSKADKEVATAFKAVRSMRNCEDFFDKQDGGSLAHNSYDDILLSTAEKLYKNWDGNSPFENSPEFYYIAQNVGGLSNVFDVESDKRTDIIRGILKTKLGIELDEHQMGIFMEICNPEIAANHAMIQRSNPKPTGDDIVGL